MTQSPAGPCRLRDHLSHAIRLQISAKVILVTLQKEQGLVTSRSPGQGPYPRDGDGVPGHGTVRFGLRGFPVQVVEGASQLKTYYAGAFARQPGSCSILYNPNADCGSSVINIRTAAAALYNYTPYQPNTAALANLYGTGDSCSSYGNHNFFRYYTDWFGSTQGDQFISRTDVVDYLAAIDRTGYVGLPP